MALRDLCIYYSTPRKVDNDPYVIARKKLNQLYGCLPRMQRSNAAPMSYRAGYEHGYAAALRLMEKQFKKIETKVTK